MTIIEFSIKNYFIYPFIILRIDAQMIYGHIDDNLIEFGKSGKGQTVEGWCEIGE